MARSYSAAVKYRPILEVLTMTKLFFALTILAFQSIAFADSDAIHIHDAYIFETPPNAPVAGGYLTIINHSDVDDRLVSAATNLAQETQIHTMSMENDVMRMQELAEGLAVPAGETVILKQGAEHLMFMQLNQAPKNQQRYTVTLRFEKAGDIAVEFTTVKMSEKTNHKNHDKHHHGHHKH